MVIAFCMVKPEGRTEDDERNLKDIRKAEKTCKRVSSKACFLSDERSRSKG